MEYDYVHDTITGGSRAIFSTEHEVMGPWLEVEVGSEQEKLKALLVAIDEVEQGRQQEVMITGSEYSVKISKEDVHVATNVSLNGAEHLPQELAGEAIDFDATGSTECGIDDFRHALLAWARFNKMN